MAEDSDIFFDYSGRDVEEKDGSVWGFFFCFCKMSFIKRIQVTGSRNFKQDITFLQLRKAQNFSVKAWVTLSSEMML